MAASERPKDRGAEDARRAASAAGIELRSTRQGLGLSLQAAANAAGISASHLSRLERGQVRDPTLGLLSRVGRVLGLATSLRFFPAGSPVRDAGQMRVLARFVRLVVPPLVMPREVPLPIQGDLRAWDGMLVGGQRIGFVEGEVHLGDTQAMARRIALKQRDDPRGEVVILVVTRSAHNRRVLAEHRAALRAQFPLDGAAIARALRTGLVPSASGIIML